MPIEKIREMGLKKGDKVEIRIVIKKKLDGFGIAKGTNSFEEEKEEHSEFW